MGNETDFEKEFQDSYRAFTQECSNADLFSFTEVMTDEEYEEEQIEHSIEVVQVTKEIMDEAKRLSDSAVPDFVWNPIVNEFDDDFDYISAALSGESEIMIAATGLKNKYQNYFEWQDALGIWNEYRRYVEETYGSWDYYKEAVQDGVLSAFVKNCPKLKKSFDNKGLDKIKFALSRDDPSEALGYDMLKLITDGMPDIYEEITDDQSQEVWEMAAKVNSGEMKRSEIESRLSNIYKIGSLINDQTSQVDAMLQFVRGETQGAGDNYHPAGWSMSKEIEAMHQYDCEDPVIVDHELDILGGRRTLTVDSDAYDTDLGMYRSVRDTDIEDFFTALASNGYDAMGFMNGLAMDKVAQKKLRGSILRNGGSMTEKEMKKLKKKERKAKQRMLNVLNSDKYMRNVLIPNRIDLTQLDDDLAFTMTDMLRGDYT